LIGAFQDVKIEFFIHFLLLLQDAILIQPWFDRLTMTGGTLDRVRKKVTQSAQNKKNITLSQACSEPAELSKGDLPLKVP
jgi:hypothetical protein